MEYSLLLWCGVDISMGVWLLALSMLCGVSMENSNEVRSNNNMVVYLAIRRSD